MSLATAVIRLSTLAVSPRGRHMGVALSGGCSIIKNSSRPSFYQVHLAWLEELPTTEVYGVCPESFLHQQYFTPQKASAYRWCPVAAGVKGLNIIRGRCDLLTCQCSQKVDKCAVFREKKFFCRLVGKCCQFFLPKWQGIYF